MFGGPINSVTLSKWQSLVNLMAKAFSVPAGFIVRNIENGYEVLIASTNEENPYQAGGIIPSETNIFCRKVVTECKMLAIYEATKLKEWETNPEVSDDGFNTYVGFPIHAPDGSVFGTICVMDFQMNPLNGTYLELLEHFKSVVELDLTLLTRLEDVTELSLKDDLTGLYNRRGFNVLSQTQYQLAKRNFTAFAFLIIDIDLLKNINDKHGHAAGDAAIVALGNSLKAACRRSDLVARVGGDEFYVALYLNDKEEVTKVIDRATQYLQEHQPPFGPVTFSWGCSVKNCEDIDFFNLAIFLEEADKAMYANKACRKV